VVSYTSLAEHLSEQAITARVAVPHDDARARYALERNRAATFPEFTDVITRYYIYHYSTCVAPGATLAVAQARSEVKRLLEGRLRRGEGDIVTYFVRARDGTDGGLRVILDTIAEGLKAQAVANYVRDVFDCHVEPQCFEDKVEMIRQIIKACGDSLSSAVRADQVERYAMNYQELINDYLRSLQSTSAMFRRL